MIATVEISISGKMIVQRADSYGIHSGLMAVNKQLKIACSYSMEVVYESASLHRRFPLKGKVSSAYVRPNTHILQMLAKTDIYASSFRTHNIHIQIAGSFLS